MSKKFWIAAGLTLSTLTGCSSGTYLVDKPLILNPQGAVTPAGTDQQTRSLQALLAAFADNRWEIRQLDKAAGIVEAEACQRREHCAEVRATVKPDGSVEILRTPGQKLDDNEEVQLKRWLGRLQRSYDKHLRARP